MLRKIRRCNVIATACYFVLLVCLIYVEFVSYEINRFNWPKLPSCNSVQRCMRILFVADPQIIGQHNEIYHRLTNIAILDSDRFLRKSYAVARAFTKPHLVIFLGDLMDEGSTANSDEFTEYVTRLRHIFAIGATQEPASEIKYLWLPGDNDIGGEVFDMITKEKVHRFNRAFGNFHSFTINNVTFFNVNRLLGSLAGPIKKKQFTDTSAIYIALSHLPLVAQPSFLVETVFQEIYPQALFTAHHHHSRLMTLDVASNHLQLTKMSSKNDSQLYHFMLGQREVFEISVPTCSYRMGTLEVGYGFAMLYGDELLYTVLWSPVRMHQLRFYTILMGVVFIAIICLKLRQLLSYVFTKSRFYCNTVKVPY